MSTQTMSEQIALLKNIIANLRGQVEEADAALERICTALTEESGIVKQETDFARLRYEGGKHPYAGHPAARSSMPELYYLLLLTVLTSAEATEAQWMHLYRVAAGAGYEQDVRDLLPGAHAITDAKIIECVESLHRDNLVNAFLLDAMLLALLHGESPALLEYIAGLFALIGAPLNAVSETIQAAKHIVAQEREAYFEGMVDAEQIDILESYFYLYQPDGQVIINDLVQAESIVANHLTVLCINGENTTLNLDEWKAKRISFRGCTFENSRIKSRQKEVNFIGCSFHDKHEENEYGGTYISLQKTSTFRKCIFKNIYSREKVLHLHNTAIERCVFSDCTIRHSEEQAIPFLELYESTLTDSKFIRCCCNTIVWRYQQFFLFGQNISIIGCNFFHCETNATRDTSASIIRIIEDSTIHRCVFEACSISEKNLSSRYRYIIYMALSQESDNSFHNCSCNELIHMG